MRILGLDYGRRRVGVAISDPDGKIATPYITLIIRDIEGLIVEIEDIVLNEGIELIVLGNPIRDDGKVAGLSAEIEKFAKKLEGNLGIKVKLIDEYYSSARAKGKLVEDRGLKLKGKKHLIDQMAAVDILQNYLDYKT